MASSTPSRLAVWILSLLALVLVGTIAVLSTVKSFFGVDWSDQVTLEEVQYFNSSRISSRLLPYNSTAEAPYTIIEGERYEYERIPRILHQTWKTDALPEKWASFSAQCKAMHPDYEYMLWTDASARDFIAENYSWFLPTYEGYPHNIQRADAIRYFVLHKYGGVYLDLDIGCRRPMDPLLNFPAILPITKPVGISNDLMFAEPNSPFMDTVIHNLIAFDHQYLSAYPTVMFSTGPMFLSAMLALWDSKEASGVEAVRVLPKILYGKNIDPIEVPDSFFWHYYGSSWHEGDSGFIVFLGTFGRTILNVLFVVVALGTLKLVWNMRYVLFGKLCCRRGAKKSRGAIRLPYHVGDGYSSDGSTSATPGQSARPRSPFYPQHSRNGSTAGATNYSSSQPGSPIIPASSTPAPGSYHHAQSKYLTSSHNRRSSEWSAASDGTPYSRPITPTLPLLASPNPSNDSKRSDSALGQRGSLFFLPLWFPTSSSPSANHDPEYPSPPPAYTSPLPAASPRLNSLPSPPPQQVPTSIWTRHLFATANGGHHVQAGATENSVSDRQPQPAFTNPFLSNQEHGNNASAFDTTASGALYNRGANVPANPGSDADALSLHEIIQGKDKSRQ